MGVFGKTGQVIGDFIHFVIDGQKVRFPKSMSDTQIEQAINNKVRLKRAAGEYNKDDYLKSQVTGHKAKRLSPEMKSLRKEIREKRRDRSINKRYSQKQTGSISKRDLQWELNEFKARKARQAIIDNSLIHAENNKWSKNEISKIKSAAEINYNVAGEKTKANLKATVREMKKKGWKNTHTSQHNGRTSSYYLEKDGHKVRLSDHDLPDTAQRRYNTSQGVGGDWGDEIVVDQYTNVKYLSDNYKPDIDFDEFREKLDDNNVYSKNLLASAAGLGVLKGADYAYSQDEGQDTQAAFIGKLAKTWGKEAAQKAEEMLAKGATRDEIWKATGDMGSPTFKDVDGHWKQEIDDNASYSNGMLKDESIRGQNYKVGNVDNAFMGDVLDSYPHLREAQLVDYPFNGDAAAQYMPASKYFDSPESITLWDGSKFQGKKSSVAHELQHAVQHKEGFAQGGNAKYLKDSERPVNPQYLKYQEHKDLADEANYILNSDLYKKELSDSNDLWTKEYYPKLEAAQNKQKKHLAENNIQRSSKEGRESHKNMMKVTDSIFDSFDEAQKRLFPSIQRVDEISKIVPTKQPERLLSKDRTYRLLAGEAEARNVQTRMPMGMDDRVAKPPWTTLDVPENELIVKGVQGLGASAALLGGISQASQPQYENGIPVLSNKQLQSDANWKDSQNMDDWEVRPESTVEAIPDGWRGNTHDLGMWLKQNLDTPIGGTWFEGLGDYLTDLAEGQEKTAFEKYMSGLFATLDIAP